MKELNEFVATGRRKTSVSSVRLRPNGSGKVLINGRNFEEYFTLELQRSAVLAPLAKFDLGGNYDLVVQMKGGGIQGQVIATRLGISRALVLQDEAKRPDLKDLGYLTRDSRKRERKKYGLAGARKRFQFSKR